MVCRLEFNPKNQNELFFNHCLEVLEFSTKMNMNASIDWYVFLQAPSKLAGSPGQNPNRSCSGTDGIPGEL